MNELLIAGRTDVGQRRQDNQDTFISTPIWSDTSALLAVIDGVGGYAGGEQAAAIARESIERYMAAPNGDPLTMLREAVVFANNQINEARQQQPKLARMCCVLTAAVADVAAGRLYYAHVGDTRLYRYRRDTLEKLTADHSMVGMREDARELTESEAMQHPRRNEILREVGSTAHRVDDADFLDSGETDFQPGDALLLCSDGLTDMITQAQITGVLNRQLSLDSQVDGLIKLANSHGGHDNITVVLAKNNAPPAPKTTGQPHRKASGQTPNPQPPPEPDRTTATPAKSGPGIWLLVAGLLLTNILTVVWYQSRTPTGPNPLADSTTTTTPAAAMPIATPSRLDSLVQTAQRSADHRLALPGDTLRLTQPLLITDSLQTIIGGNPLTVLMPADTTQSQAALRVMGQGTVNLENLVIRGFKTGIETNGPARLQLKNVYFQAVRTPVSAAVRQDTFRNTVLLIFVQDQPLRPNPPRN